ncbi:MAG: cytochrome C [Gammaproteobacteria bacterium HGW-Gammaproteobacteria-6]|jgi:cytochrome c553|nr:MAG: cytochrome C [Gammaproteobacteria bacterium HGW-Gammaproteobacteria-6]
MKPLNLFALASLTLAAIPFAAVHAEGDPALGRQLAYTCTGCHGIEGYKNAYPQYHVPRIAGQNYEYLLSALIAYQKGERVHPTMQAQAESFSETDLQNLAAFIASAGKVTK